MIVIRLIAWLLLLATLVAVGAELVASLQAGQWTPLAAGELWFKTHTESLNLSQAVIQRYIHPAVWDPGVVTVLLWPVWAVTLIPAVLFLLIGRRRPARRRGRRLYRR